MTMLTDAPTMSDDLWHALFQDAPDACPTHHCWADQCPAGAHGATAAIEGGEA
ncbi:hypothetical protein [Streptomyces sp. NPDC059994]|uniref:hypothetical protein n=1 Tax=Streptomyces sp. NPDC059994 TaxID=3347029 RepID=UPI0036C196B5